MPIPSHKSLDTPVRKLLTFFLTSACTPIQKTQILEAYSNLSYVAGLAGVKSNINGTKLRRSSSLDHPVGIVSQIYW